MSINKLRPPNKVALPNHKQKNYCGVFEPLPEVELDPEPLVLVPELVPLLPCVLEDFLVLLFVLVPCPLLLLPEDEPLIVLPLPP